MNLVLIKVYSSLNKGSIYIGSILKVSEHDNLSTEL